MKDRFLGCLFGLAVGDAVGTTVEFAPRGSFVPLTDMVGGGPFNLNVGEWTDDMSMALCLAQSLLHQNGFNAKDQMNRYVNWRDHGYMSSNGRCFDIGNTVNAALRRYLATGDPLSGSTDPFSAGNGSIMRLAPVPMFYFGDEEAVVRFSAESSKTTHAAEECIDACAWLGGLLASALGGASKEEILAYDGYSPRTPTIQQIAQRAYRLKTADQIKGSGYVVESLEAALWCFDKTTDFRSAILKAANLGDDADTTAAITGQIAGAYYGYDGIPQPWRERVALFSEIMEIGVALYNHWKKQSA